MTSIAYASFSIQTSSCSSPPPLRLPGSAKWRSWSDPLESTAGPTRLERFEDFVGEAEQLLLALAWDRELGAIKKTADNAPSPRHAQ